jgi:hypothetical protein
MRSFLVVLQVALALVLLVTSGLMMRTFRNLHDVDPGFRNAQEIQTVRIGIPDEDVKEPERVIHMEQAMLERVKTVNGVISASIISSVPMGGGESNDPVYAADKTYREGTIAPLRRYKSIAPGYFTTMGQRMLVGRDLTWGDIYNGGYVAIVSENTARDIWGARTPRSANASVQTKKTTGAKSSAWLPMSMQTALTSPRPRSSIGRCLQRTLKVRRWTYNATFRS